MQKWICNVRNRENALTYEEDAKKCLTAGIVRNNNFGQIFQRIGI